MPTANINGFMMYYETRGEGFPLVYIHGGFGGMGTGLQPETLEWIEEYAKYFQVITYDRRAAGRSSYPEEGFTMQNLAKDVLELLRHLGYERAHIWGTSVGGQIALAFGLHYPEAAASLVITDSAPWLSLDEELKEKLRERIRVLNEKGAEAAYEARAVEGTVGLNLFTGRPAGTEEEEKRREAAMERTKAQLRAISRDERIAKYAGELRNYSAYLDWDATPQLKDIKIPTLVLYGTEDSVFPPQGSLTMIRLIPNVEYRAFQGAEHRVTRLPEVIEPALSFLRRHT
jgi:pimeloyl-ACP methyl ester carboxylesterase